ncbi:ribosome biogenesis GTPase [Kineococcus xinjiangensis]|uniref:Small ribosomal subunit biogenesis GTPase RsgA n=1 Tax=Kineococcus xinjiangensis TaxID=512762 RepID=A0A2S6IX39_9ACTN|nr:ribosome small subunit-dependent GTPase A [Kineococcus xinjiangensis]PPK98721.1 ribosome biogenesis GTPase [Kineococcus xinjiangensis]
MPADRRPRRYDEDDVRIRPNRHGSRPRTKERPSHSDAVQAFVVAVDRGRSTCLVGAGNLGALGPDAPGARLVTAMRARELGRQKVVVGDLVALVGDVSGQPDALARIVRIEERRSVLRRTADDTDPVERVVVANADQLVLVTAVADPEPRPRLVDRCLVAAYDAGMTPLLCLTKADLRPPEEVLSTWAPLGLEAVSTSRREAAEGAQIAGLDELRARLTGRVSVLVGHSGVGKSTLVNALVPSARRATGRVNDVTGRGRHTSTSAAALALEGGGWVIDTPGIRSFGLAHVDPERVLLAFPDLVPATADCPRGCTHDEPECGLDGFVEAGGAGAAGPVRLVSLRRLLRARSSESGD